MASNSFLDFFFYLLDCIQSADLINMRTADKYCKKAQPRVNAEGSSHSQCFGTGSRSHSSPFTWVISNAALGTTILFKAFPLINHR